MQIGDYVTIQIRGRIIEAKSYRYSDQEGEKEKVLYTLQSSEMGEGAYFCEDKVVK